MVSRSAARASTCASSCRGSFRRPMSPSHQTISKLLPYEKLTDAINRQHRSHRIMSTPISNLAVQPLDSSWVRVQFPSLHTQVHGQPAAFLDGPAGTQVPTRVIHAIQNYLLTSNANTGGAFLTSRRTEEIISNARAAMADFFHCERDEVIFGQNMTTITFAISRAIARELNPGDEILLTVLDHDANFSPWKALEEKGIVIRTADIRED